MHGLGFIMAKSVSDFIKVAQTEPESLYIWLDILSFSKEIEFSNNKAELSETLELFRNTFSSISKKTVSVSDGILIALDIQTPQWNIESLREIFLELANGQLEFFIKKQRVVRGGISIGNQINKDDWDKGRFISNGMTKAYSLESKFVSWPIIGMDQSSVEKIKQKTKIAVKTIVDHLNLAESLNEYGDKIYFLKFAESKPNYIQVYQNQIKMFFYDKIKNEDGRVLLKYIWLYKYFKQTWGIDLKNYEEWVL